MPGLVLSLYGGCRPGYPLLRVVGDARCSNLYCTTYAELHVALSFNLLDTCPSQDRNTGPSQTVGVCATSSLLVT